jgi:hypothetical protein
VGGIHIIRCRIEYAIDQVKESVMKPTRLARNLRRVSTIAIAATSVLALSTSASGQEADKPAAPASATQAPASAAQPAAPAPAKPTGQAEAAPIPPPPPGGQAVQAPPASNNPPPGYGPPPGVPYNYYNQPSYPGYPPGYAGYVPAPARPVTYRPFMFGVGLGLGSLTYSASSDTKREPALAYSVHLGFSITSRWMALLAMDGSWGQFDFNDPTVKAYGKVSVAVSSYTAGIQFFILRSLYARLGLGLACLEWSDDEGDWSDCHGQTAVGGLGYEFLQTHSTAVAAELGGFVSRFPDAMTINDRNDIWYHIGANMVLRLY